MTAYSAQEVRKAYDNDEAFNAYIKNIDIVFDNIHNAVLNNIKNRIGYTEELEQKINSERVKNNFNLNKLYRLITYKSPNQKIKLYLMNESGKITVKDSTVKKLKTIIEKANKCEMFKIILLLIVNVEYGGKV